MITDSDTSILIIYTGGTIGMILDNKSGTLLPFSFEHISEHIPELNNFDFEINCISFEQVVDSSNMDPGLWVKLAELIEKHYEEYDGFVILHGSDTMAYTASALSFMLENLNKPVILTGSQLPIGVNRTDGKENIITSLEIAAAKENDTPVIPEVCIYFEYQLYRGNRTYKFNAENFDAFRSDNYPVLANAGVYLKYNYNYIMKPNFRKLKVHKQLDPNIAVLKLFPGIRPQLVNAVLNVQGLKGVILETYGTGNIHTDAWFIESLRKAIDNGIIILDVTQCQGGSVEIGKYEASVPLGEIGVIGGNDITTESAVSKMMYLFGKKLKQKDVESMLRKSLRGEITIN